MAATSKTAKWQHEEEDRISNLPDSLIQHILSLLPSTKEAIQTTVLSKRWRNQWTHVPVLIFSNSGMSDERFSRFIDDTLLHLDSSKIQKFHILSEGYEVGEDPHFDLKLCFAIRKGVEELILEFKRVTAELWLPDYIFKHAFLIKLHLFNCIIAPDGGSISWPQLKELNIHYSTLSDASFQSLLIGSPLLEWLQLKDCFGFSQLKIASKTLKRLVLLFHDDLGFDIEISCPNLEELRLLSWSEDMSVQVKDVSSLSCASLDYDASEDVDGLVQNLQQLQNVKELTFGNTLIETLARFANEGYEIISFLKNKSLTLDNPDFGRNPSGIAFALRIFPKLEKLVIKDLVYEAADLPTSYWDSKGSASNSIVSCLKTVHIVGLGKSHESKVPHDFVDFLLQNSPVMEKLVMLKDR